MTETGDMGMTMRDDDIADVSNGFTEWKNYVFEYKPSKRYTVMHFPSLYGSPWMTNSWFLSRVFAMLYRLRYPTAEVRIVDRVTDKHEVWR